MSHRNLACSGRQHDRLDVLLIGAVLAFAFLAASFLESSGDFWSHLVAGRRLADDGFSLRSTLLPPGIFDLALYTSFQGIGGIALIVLKALGFAVLAWLLLPPRARRADATSLVACTLLALLTMSPYASLRPAMLSYFFLALTLRILLSTQGREAASYSVWGWNRCVLLGSLFVLWVNLDRWFWLGPLLVSLFWMGQRLERFPGRSSGRARLLPSRRSRLGRSLALPSSARLGRSLALPTRHSQSGNALDDFLGSDSGKSNAKQRIPAWLPLACWFVCLLNPLGIGAFALSSTWLPQPWWSASPWQPERLLVAIQRMDLAALAYPVLMMLGLVSFAFPGVHERGTLTLVWGSLAALSSWQSAMVPFFALVAGPITALNWQDGLRQMANFRSQKDDCSAVSPSSIGNRKSALINRWVLLATSLVLIFLAGIGGLHGVPRAGTIPGWGVDADPSSRQFVQTIRQWRQRNGLRPDDRLLAPPGDLATYFAWFAPEENLTGELQYELPTLEAACRSGKGNLVAVDDPDLLRKLAGDPEHWLLLHVEGRITLWGWKEACSNQTSLQPFAANRLVFASEDEAETLLPPLSESALQNYTPARRLLDRLVPRPGPLGPDSEAASTYLRYFQAAMLPPYQRNWLHGWSACAASLIAPPPPHALSLVLRLEQSPLFLSEIEKDLPAFPLLAIRAARRALATHPDDANAYLCLGQAYRYLWETTGERDRCRDTSLLAQLRQTQAATALEQAVRLEPDSPTAHQLLAELYQEQGYLDAALEHRREEVRLAHRNGCRPGEDARSFARRLQRLEQQGRALEGMVWERQKRFASLPASVTQPRERAVAALRLGMARQALDEILLPSSPVLLESSGVNMELELMLRLGRIEQLREWMQGEDLQRHGENLGLHSLSAPSLPGSSFSTHRLPAASWFRFLWAAAQGDYELSQGQLREMLVQLESARQEQLRSLRRSLALTVANEVLLSAQPELLLLQLLGHKDTKTARHLLNSVLTVNGAGADLCVLAGALALEAGRTDQAERHFEMALGTGYPGAGNRPDFAARPLAEFYLQRLQVTQGRVYRLP